MIELLAPFIISGFDSDFGFGVDLADGLDVDFGVSLP